MWEAKMLGAWVPCEGESLRDAYAYTYNKDGTFKVKLSHERVKDDQENDR